LESNIEKVALWKGPKYYTGGRNPALQPYPSTDVWNIGVGSNATWTASTDGPTTTLNGLTGTIDYTDWTLPQIVSRSTDLLISCSVTDTNAPVTTTSLHIPIGTHPSTGYYTVASFTGSQSGTTLTVTTGATAGSIVPYVTRVIGPGIAGTWGETIIAQVSGTTGGNGVYTTDRSLTIASGTALTAVSGDQTLNIYDTVLYPGRVYSFWGCWFNNNDTSGAVTAGTTQLIAGLGGVWNISNTGSGVYPYGTSSFPLENGTGTVGADNYSTGLIRDWEVTAGVIKHAIRVTLSANVLASPGNTWTSNIPWPNGHEDYCGPPVQYTGCGSQLYTGGTNGYIYGTTCGIPASVNLGSLGLSAPGLMLATAIQKYGLIETESGGTHQAILATDNISSGNLSTMATMQSDWASKIVPILRIMTNQSPDGTSNINGGGSYPPPLPPVNTRLNV
jgi:hypothetical protein